MNVICVIHKDPLKKIVLSSIPLLWLVLIISLMGFGITVGTNP